MEEHELILHLSEASVDIKQWNGKTPVDLLEEVNAGECQLLIKKNEGTTHITRKVKLVTAQIFHIDDDGEILELFEERQILPDGREKQRTRSHAISGKVMRKERFVDGLLRELGEEIQLFLGKNDFLRPTKNQNGPIKFLRRDRENNDPNTKYAGLVTCSTIARFDIILPPKDFNPEGYIEVSDGITTYFKWRKLEK